MSTHLKLVAGVLALAVVIGMAVGCGPKDGNRNQGSGNSPAQSPKAEADPNAVTPAQQWSGTNAEHGEAKRLVIRKSDEWKNAWEKATAKQDPRPDVPAVNFEIHMVVAVFMGKKNTGGFEVKIEKIVKTENGGLKITVKETKPEPGAPVTQAETSPYHIVVIPTFDGEVEFVTAE